MKFLKIGLIVDDYKLDNFNSELFTKLAATDFCKIEAVIINRKKKNKYDYNKILKKYSLIRIFEKILFKLIFLFEKNILYNFSEKYKFELIDLKNKKNKTLFVDPIISKKGYFYEYSDIDIKKIDSLNLDVLIRMGAGILRGKILDIGKHGILSYHHGDNDMFRGGPPGFWEVFYKKTSTGFVIQKLNNNLDGGDIYFKGSVNTQYYFYKNQQFVYKQSAKYLEIVLKKIFNQNANLIENKVYYNKIFKDPSIIQILEYIIKTYSFIIFKVVNVLLAKKENWMIGFAKSKFNEKRLEQYKIIKNKNGFFADPFLFKKDNTNYLFVEDYSFEKKKGVISCFKLNEKNNEHLGTVLTENFHLSFPFIFEYDNQIYMCPETHEIKEIRLYKCIDFPHKWKYETTLIKNISAVDNIIFKRNNIWWLLTNTDTNELDHNSELSIYYSNNGPVTENWKPHSLNPIYVNPDKARNGGLINHKENIYRVNQKIGFNSYGSSLEINKIDEIDEKVFEETLFSKVEPNFAKGLNGCHHMNNNDEYTVFDFLKRKYFFNR